MRKFLLFACAAVFAVSASAQSIKDKVLTKASVNVENCKLNPSVPARLTFGNPYQGVAKKAPARVAHDGIYGLYIYSSTDYTLENAGCDSVIIEKESATLDNEVLDTKITFRHESLPFVVYGKYDAQAKTITCPALQYVAEYIGTSQGSDVDWKIMLSSWVGNNVDDAKWSNEPVVFNVDDDGSITPDVVGLCWAIDEGAESISKTWDSWFSVDMKPANAVISYSRFDSNDNEIQYANVAYVEDYETVANVYGYAWFPGASGFGLSCIATMDINTDTKAVNYKAGQNVWPCRTLGVTDEEAGDWWFTYGITDIPEKPGYVTYDNSENASVDGIVEGNMIKMNPQPVGTKIWSDPATKEPRGYMMWLSKLCITLDEGNFMADSSNGIADVNAQKNVKSGKTYNVFGQEVPAATKGLVIRDGKKFFNK